MSIYPVRIKEWFPPFVKTPKNPEEVAQNKSHRQTIRICLNFMKCHTCGKKINMRNGWIYHALPWGYGANEAWCSQRCLEKT